MLPILMIAGVLLGVWLGAAARPGLQSRRWPDFKKLRLVMALIPAVGVIGLIPGHGNRLPQLCGYLVGLATGYILATMLEPAPGVSEWAEISLPPRRPQARAAGEVVPLPETVAAASQQAAARAV